MSSSNSSISGSTSSKGSPVRFLNWMKSTEPVFCYCRVDGRHVVAAQNTAWTDENAGRGFFCCRKSKQPGGCAYWKWADEVIDVKESRITLMKILRDEIFKLRNKNIDLQAEVNELNVKSMKLLEAADSQADVNGLNAEIMKLKMLLQEKVDGKASKKKKKGGGLEFFKPTMQKAIVLVVVLVVLLLFR